MKRRFRLTVSACLIAASAALHMAAPAAAANGIVVQGNKLLRDGQPFVPLGFTMVGLLSPTRTGTAGTAADHYGQTELDAAKTWNANTMRFQISQRGFDPTDALYTSSYVQRVIDGVALARANGFAIILSMQDQSYSGGDATPMPEPQTLRSWEEVTACFNGDPHIIYELWNEPMVKDTAAEWVLWRDGGALDGQTVIGHQALLDCVRGSGATNVLIAEGTRVGKSFIGCPDLVDPLGQLAYGIHPYLNWPINDPAKWDLYFGDWSATYPVVATEWNAHSGGPYSQDHWPTLSPQLLSYLKSHDIGLAAWAFDIVDTLIQDWSWTPTTLDGWQTTVKGYGAGELVKAHYLSYAVSVPPPAPDTTVYNHYFGDTHSHTGYSDGDLYSAPSLPADHFALAKQTGHDFYAVTDHALAKYPNFTPASYEDTKYQADVFTDSTFVAIAGFEFSENDGPAGTGHINAFNTASYLDATGSSVNLPVFYDWLGTNQSTPVMASFNHPGSGSYGSFEYLTEDRRERVTMLEIINGGNLHYDAFIAALNKGWRVAPNAATDTHGTWRVTRHFYRTGILAPSLTRENLMQAMKARRVYATFDQNLRVTVRANGQIMGSVLYGPSALDFEITVSDPDTGTAGDAITRIEVRGENGTVVDSASFNAHSVTWNPAVAVQHSYYFCTVFTADKTDGPTAYAAPFWIEAGGAPQPSAAPSGLAATSVSDTEINLTWTDVSWDETGFDVERMPSGGAWSSCTTLGAGTAAYADVGLAASSSYTYRIRATNAAGNSPWSNESTATTFPAPPGPGAGTGILREQWNGVPGTATSDLLADARYPDAPDESELLGSFEGPTNAGDSYGSRLRGCVIAPVTGAYVFTIAADDNARLLLNATGSAPEGAIEIAHVPGWTASREWTKYPEQCSAPVTLQAGARYYVEVIHKEGTGGDNVAVKWQLPSGAVEAPIPGHRLEPNAEPEPRAPYGGTPHAVPGQIQAEDYDAGGEGVAYHDTDASNAGGAYRTDDVDIEICDEGGHDVGWIRAGEWMEYTIEVSTTDAYDVSLRVASESAGGTVRLLVDGIDDAGEIPFSATGGWQDWQTVAACTVEMTAGPHVMRLDIIEGGFNLNWIGMVAAVVATDTDTDADGLPDDWEIEQFGDLSEDGAGDYDGDGHTNIDELVAGTSPLDPASVPEPTGTDAGVTDDTFSCAAGHPANGAGLQMLAIAALLLLLHKREAAASRPWRA